MRLSTLPRSAAGLVIFGCVFVAAVKAATTGDDRVSYKFPTQTLTVPAGFSVELVAAPPMVNRPISVAFDDEGRLYVTDSSGLSERAEKQFEQKPHRIVRLMDRDGDGRFEASTVFAENLMFPQGAMFYEGSLYVGAPPHIWRLTDVDGDGVAEKRAVWFDGKTLTGCANDLHGPYLGPEGWFYWTKGAFAEQRHTLGNGREFVTRAAHIFRARPDGTGLEPVLTGGMDNPVGVAFTATGERVLSGTFFQIGTAGKRDGLIHAIYGGVYGKENASAAGHPRTGDLMPIMTHMGAAAPCGSLAYRSSSFGAEYRDNLFVCYFNLRKISRHVMVPDGATYRTVDTDFVTSDSLDFHPTDVQEDADGSLLVVDTGGWYKICCPTSQLAKPDVLGGIYRIRKIGAPIVADARGLKLPWAEMKVLDLAKLLGDARPDVRQRAMHLLGQRGAAAVGAVSDVLASGQNGLARQAAAWTLARIDHEQARVAVRGALTDRDATVAQSALNVVSLWRDAAATEPLIGMLAAGNPMVVRLAAEALGRIGDPRAIKPLLAAAERLTEKNFTASGSPEVEAERGLEHAVIYALIEIARPEAVAAHLAAGAGSRAIRVALVALDQMNGGALAVQAIERWLDEADPQVRQTAWWIAERHPEWGEVLAVFLGKQIALRSRTARERTELVARLARLAAAPAIQEVLATTLSAGGSNEETRLIALNAMATAGLKAAPERWCAALAAQLASAERSLVPEVVTTVRAVSLPKAGHAGLSLALMRVGRDGGFPAAVRLEALAALAPAVLAPVDETLFDFLLTQLGASESMSVRGNAATVLGKASLSGAQQLLLADRMKTVGAMEAEKLLAAFERAPSQVLGLRVIAALRNAPGLSALRANVLKGLFAKYPPSVQAKGDELIATANADLARQNVHVDQLLATLQGGDIRRGQEVFHAEKTSCTLCHMLGYRGGRLGPDLTNIGKIRSERELLEAIVFPSATLVRGFEPLVITTKTGETHSGIVRKDAVDEIVLATGPDTEQRLARSDVKLIEPGTVSPMPPGMETMLTRQELADLVAFLKSRQ